MKKRLFSILLTLCMAICLVPITAFAEDGTGESTVCTYETVCTQETPFETVLAQMNVEGKKGIAIDAVNFPDANFRSIVTENYDTDKDGNLSDTEIAAVEKIDCVDKGISSLKGIEYFTALKVLLCSQNQLTVLDVSKNIELSLLSCYRNQLTTLDIGKNAVLEELYCDDNQLTTLNISENPSLKFLRCRRNQLSTLDVSKNTMLIELSCGKNQLDTLDVSKNLALTNLICNGNQLDTLDVSKNTALTYLTCNENQLTTLNISENPSLKILRCYQNQLSALDVSKNTMLTELSCDDNQLTMLDLSKNTVLEELYCNSNQLTSLDISSTDMDELECSHNVYQINIGSDRTFDLSTLSGNFDVSKTSNWNGGTVSGNILTVDNDTDTVIYTYDCGKNQQRTFTLKCNQYADYSKVDAAIAKANALNKDDYKDFSAVEAAVRAVVRGKNITEQTEVDAMAKAIEDAISALLYKDADHTKVDAEIVKANVSEDAITAPEKKPANTKPGTSDKSLQTGDTSNLALWIALLFVSVGATIGTIVVSRKKK